MLENNKCKNPYCGTILPASRSFCSIHELDTGNYLAEETINFSSFNKSGKFVHFDRNEINRIFRSIYKNSALLIIILLAIAAIGAGGFAAYKAILFIGNVVSNFSIDGFLSYFGVFLFVCGVVSIFIDENSGREVVDVTSSSSGANKSSSSPTYRTDHNAQSITHIRNRNTGLKNLNLSYENFHRIPSRRAGVYMIKCKVNGRVYVGESKNLKGRMGAHLSKLQMNTHESKEKKKKVKLQNDYNQYGPGQFSFEILEFTGNCKKNDRWDIEAEYIKKFNSVENGYNSLSHQSQAFYIDK